MLQWRYGRGGRSNVRGQIRPHIQRFGIGMRDLCACVGHPVFDSNHKAGRCKRPGRCEIVRSPLGWHSTNWLF